MTSFAFALRSIGSALVGLTLIACASASADGPPNLSNVNRAELIDLRSQDKFQPDLLAGYTGADLPEDVAPLNAAVNDLIDAVLARPDGPLNDSEVRELIEMAVGAVDLFATEDRERAYRYIGIIWSTLGFDGDPLDRI